VVRFGVERGLGIFGMPNLSYGLRKKGESELKCLFEFIN
jgi:hypothetical protein